MIIAPATPADLDAIDEIERHSFATPWPRPVFEAELSRRGRDDAWYQRWYVLAAASLVVAGAGGTAIYFGTRDTGGPAGDGKLGITVVIQ